jgi:hypothetical protein
MSLHRVEKNPEAITTTPRYAAELSARSLPKHKMPENGVPADDAHAIVRSGDRRKHRAVVGGRTNC